MAQGWNNYWMEHPEQGSSMNKDIATATKEAVELLQQLIAVPSFSREEGGTADLIQAFLTAAGIAASRVGHNVFARNLHFDEAKPTILLNSHHDTVRPNPGYTRNPYEPIIEGGKLYGLGSNDAGGALVALITVFLYYYSRKGLKYNLILAATAEEEISGKGGIEALLPHLPPVESAIVGEPTGMQLAVAERGLMVVDGLSTGVAGHAARNEGDNALYKALDDVNKIRALNFPKVSPLLGPVSLNVTVLRTENVAHNVVPSTCDFTVDVRVNELYSLEEVLHVLRASLCSQLTPRSMRLRPTSIDGQHPLVVAGKSLGLHCYGSPTTSDKSLMPFPALKLGPGESSRSHSADEFINLAEIENGIDLYIQLLNQIL